MILLSPLSFSSTSSPRTASSAAKQQKIPISLYQLYKNIQALPDDVRDQLIPREELFLELNKPAHVSPWQKAAAALKKRTLQPHSTMENMVSAGKSTPEKRLNTIKTILLASSRRSDKRNDEYLKEALRTGNQPLFTPLLRKAENPDLAPLIKRAVIDGNESAFSEIVKKVNQPLPKETMHWLAEYGKPQKLVALLEKIPPNSYTNEERQAWTFLAESQHKKIETTKKQALNQSETRVSEVLKHIRRKAVMLDSLAQNEEAANPFRNELAQLEERDAENRLKFMVHAQNLKNLSRYTYFDYDRSTKKALQAKDNVSLDLMLNIPKFRLKQRLASELPVMAASMGNLEGLQLLLDTPGISVNQMDNSQTPLHAAAQQGHKKVVEHLLNRIGIDTNIKDLSGKTPLDIAREENHPEIIELLEQHQLSKS